MPNISVEKLLACVERSELVDKDRLTQALAEWREAEPDLFTDAERLAAKLIDAKLLTRWQCDNLLQGKSSGFVLGQYKLLGMLGTGGMSSVYLGEHLLMRVLRAIKVLPVSRVNDSSYLERFRQEAMAAARLNHPNIVQAYDIGVQGKHHYIVMEYVEGRDLQNLVKEGNGPLEYELAANYIRQAAEGLAYAHQSGLIHRDIKPANLLVDLKGVVKLLDLGLARFVDDKTPSLTIAHDENVLGTADYLAPEQAVNSHGVDARADIYSLGCTLYYLLTGHPPFPTGGLPERINAHQCKTPASIFVDRPDAPQALVDVCNRMMAKSPEARIQSAKEVADSLAAWLAARAGGSSGNLRRGGKLDSASRRAPPRRSATAIAPPPRREKTNDTISDLDRETIKGAPTSRPATAPRGAERRPGAAIGTGSSGNLGKGGVQHSGDSGRAVGRSGGIPTARALDAPEDADDVNSVLFGPSGVGSTKNHSRKPHAHRPSPMSSAKLPKWMWFVVGGVLMLSILVIICVILFKGV